MDTQKKASIDNDLTLITQALDQITQPVFNMEKNFQISEEEQGLSVEEFKPLGVVETAKIAKKIYDIKNNLDTMKKLFENLNTVLTRLVLPELIADEGLSSPVKVAGVAKLVLRNDLFVQQVANDGEAKDKFFQWLIGNGFGDLIKETVNSSSLKSSVKSILEKNNELLESNRGKTVEELPDYVKIPEEFLKVTPYVQVAFNKL